MLETKTERVRKTFLNIKNGSIVLRTGDKEDLFQSVKGKIEGIYKRDREFRGETIVYWYIDIKDEGKTYSLGLSYGSNVFKSIILSLASASSLDSIKISPYMKDGYDKVTVHEGEERLNWIVDKLPPVKEILIGGKTVKDDSERMTYIESLVEKINEKIGKQVIK